ncbi:hypothetical protein [Pseudomonas frederiksbergensis]|uniref:hypothetical protein n=1 Tax=Pseudomonas frederiksbergensis TaxID=104087 RepID=UPI00197D5410|nr:hypothetical protein [Pseudomonas frederiksbergensis]
MKNGTPISDRDHAPISRVREVLKRLCDEGVILLQADKNCRITDEAWAMLKQYLDG